MLTFVGSLTVVVTIAAASGATFFAICLGFYTSSPPITPLTKRLFWASTFGGSAVVGVSLILLLWRRKV